MTTKSSNSATPSLSQYFPPHPSTTVVKTIYLTAAKVFEERRPKLGYVSRTVIGSREGYSTVVRHLALWRKDFGKMGIKS